MDSALFEPPLALFEECLKRRGFSFHPLPIFFCHLLAGHKAIALTGGGGKTSLMISLGRLFASQGKSVMLTTTTHLSANVDYGVDRIRIIGDDGISCDERRARRISDDKSARSLLLISPDHSHEDKFRSPGIGAISHERRDFDVTIVEADGSGGLPLKFHSSFEPVIPPFITFVVSILGADAFGKPHADVMHRSGSYAIESGVSPDAAVGIGTYERLIWHPQGAFCAVPDSTRRLLVINKADAVADEVAGDAAEEFARLCERMPDCVLASVKNGYVALPEERKNHFAASKANGALS